MLDACGAKEIQQGMTLILCAGWWRGNHQWGKGLHVVGEERRHVQNLVNLVVRASVYEALPKVHVPIVIVVGHGDDGRRCGGNVCRFRSVCVRTDFVLYRQSTSWGVIDLLPFA